MGFSIAELSKHLPDLPGLQGQIFKQLHPVAAYDPDGLVFAASLNSKIIKLFDLRVFSSNSFNFRSFGSFESKDATNRGIVQSRFTIHFC